MMPDSTTFDRRAWGEDYQAFAAALADLGEEHPSSERLALLAVEPARVPREESVALEEHAESCPACRRQLELTRAAIAHGRGERRVETSPRRRAAGPARWPQRLAWAAALIAVLGVGFAAFRGDLGGWQRGGASRLSENVSGTRVVEVPDTLLAATAIEDGGDVSFRAGRSVILGNGFSVGSDVRLTVEIAGPAARQ